MFPFFGIPKIFQSDNGREFKNSKVVNLIKSWYGDCTIRYGRPRHPQSQGLVEQANGTTQRMIASLIKEHEITVTAGDEVRSILEGGSWPNLLPRIMYNLNTQMGSSIKKTPYEIAFSQEPNMGTIKQCNIEDVPHPVYKRDGDFYKRGKIVIPFTIFYKKNDF